MHPPTPAEIQSYTRKYIRSAYWKYNSRWVCIFIVILLTGCTRLERVPLPTPSNLSPEPTHPTETARDSVPSRISQPTGIAENAEVATATSLPSTVIPQISSTSAATPPTSSPNFTPTPSSIPTIELPVKQPTLAPDAWKSMPVIPTLSDDAVAIYQRGLALGNNPHTFSKIGDGEISGVWFFTDFDSGPQYYNLGDYADLQEVINYFSGSFSRQSQAARRGFNTSLVFDPSLADPTHCNPGETPLDCELRLNQPSFAILSMGTNQIWTPEIFAVEYRQIIEMLIERGIVPILSTKGDNLEGDHRINIIIAGLAYEYDIPLWNFWLAIQPLPNHGLQEDNEHLTYARNFFNNPDYTQYAWPIRNLTALQVLKSMVGKIKTVP